MLTIFNEEDTFSNEAIYDNKRLYNKMNILKQSINNEIDNNNKENDEDIIQFMLKYDE